MSGLGRAAAVVGWVLAAACTHVRAADETVAEHRAEAAEHAARSDEERAQYDPAQERAQPIHMTPGQVTDLPDDTLETYNPTEEHLVRADKEMAEANDHLVAARSLLTFENRACEGLSAGARSSCPLFASSVSRVRATKRGFVLTFKNSVNVEFTHRVLSCHLAYAVASGFDRPSCPLFVRGTTLQRVRTTELEFNGDNDAVSLELRTQARRIFLGYESASAR